MPKLESYDQETGRPTQKVAASGIGGATSVVVIWLVNTIFGIEIPAEVGAAIATLTSFITGYFVRSKRLA